MKLFEQKYDGESILDLERDIYEMWESERAKTIPEDKNGFFLGTIKVVVTWDYRNRNKND